MKKYIAYCGLDCESCEARLATVNNDAALRQKVSKEWSELNGVEITPEMINCVGCRIDGVKTPYCESLCPIRQCALKRNLETCGSCCEMDSCEKLGMIVKNNLDVLRNLKEYVFITLRNRPELMDRAAAEHGGGRHAYQEYYTSVSGHRSHRLLRALRLGIPLYGAG